MSANKDNSEKLDNSKAIEKKINYSENEELMKKMLHDEMKNKLSDQIKNNSTQFLNTLKNMLADDKKK